MMLRSTSILVGGSILLDAAIKTAPVEQLARTGFKQNIHYLRGLAALSVTFFHAALFHASEYGSGIMPMQVLDIFGIYGVAVFFAISGYLMSNLIQVQNPIDFLVRRCLRIYPLFILATLVVMAAHPKIWAEYNLASMSLAPIGDTKYPLGKIEWTLVYEIFFYVALFVVSAMGLRRYVSFIAIAWAGVIIAATLIGLQEVGFATVSTLPLRSVGIGLAGGLLIYRLERIGPAISLLIAAVFLIFALMVPSLALKVMAAGIGAVFLVAASVRVPDILPSALKAVLTKLGDWSYGLYLIHIPVLFVMYQPFFKDYGPSFLIFRIAAAVAGGAILGQIDVAIHDRTRRWTPHLRRGPALTFVSAFLAVYVAIAVAYA